MTQSTRSALPTLQSPPVRSPLAFLGLQRQINVASRCRTQAEECHRLMLVAQSGAEATILTSLTRSWTTIANQTDRYVAIMKKEAAQKR